MFEQWCKSIIGDDIWGFGIVFLLVGTITIPIVAICLGQWIVEFPKVCQRLKALEEWKKRADTMGESK